MSVFEFWLLFLLDKFNIGCLLSFFACEKPDIIVEYCTPSSAEYSRPKGKIVGGIDRKYQVLVLDTNFDNFYETSVRLWPKASAHKNYHLLIKTPTLSSSDSSEENWI